MKMGVKILNSSNMLMMQLFLKIAQAMRVAISSLEEFRKVAGTKLNIIKCERLYMDWIK